MAHAHVGAPHELAESAESVTGRERVLELVAALLMAITTVAIAWSGYQAARWSGLQAREYAQATGARAAENRLSTLAGQARLQDLLNFNRWLELTTAPESTPGSQALADLYVRRFRPEFVPAFRAWLALDPIHAADAPASPLLMPEYQLADFQKAQQLDAKAAMHFDAGKEATEHADQYVFVTVFLAAVLFFAGISLRFAWLPMRITVLGLGIASLAIAVAKLLTLPAY